MTLTLYWFLPTHGDGRGLSRRTTASGNSAVWSAQRDPSLGYLSQVAAAADQLGFAGMLVPAGLFCEDPWLVTAALAQRTRRTAFMVAFRPGLLSPTLTAQMAATCQRLTGNRLLLNVVTGGDPDEQRRYGDHLGHDRRYERAAEFLAIVRGAWSGQPYDHTGEYYTVNGALVARRPEPAPPVFLGGSSAAAQQVAATHADVYLAWGETPPELAALLAGARELATARGRRIGAGTRFNVICRDTTQEAWAVADRLVDGLDPAMVRQARQRMRDSDSEGQRRMLALHNGRPTAGDGDLHRLEVYPNIWAGYSLLRPGAGAAIVGSHTEVADRIEELHAVGVEHLILSGQPHLEEAYWFGEGVMPKLRERGLIPADCGRST